MVDSIGLTGVGQGIRVIGVLMGTEEFKREFAEELDNGEPFRLARVLVPINNAQLSSQILRLSARSPL